MADALRDWIAKQGIESKAESPIEALFWGAYCLYEHRLLLDPLKVKVQQQADVGPYRADYLFSVRCADGKTRFLVVELDGHDFHEKTKQQAAKDKARDRWMKSNGYEVIRFTGSEVWQNPFACVSEAADHVHVLLYGMTPEQARAKAGFARIRKLLDDMEGV